MYISSAYDCVACDAFAELRKLNGGTRGASSLKNINFIKNYQKN